MKRSIAILLLSWASTSFANEESQVDIAKRVIADQSSAYTPRPEIPMGVTPKPPIRKPEDTHLELATKKAHVAIRSYMLGDSVPEKTRIAYAITVLAGKRIPEPFGVGLVVGGSVDVSKNDQYLKDGLILSARLAEIQKAEDAAGRPATESKSEGNQKPQSKSGERTR